MADSYLVGWDGGLYKHTEDGLAYLFNYKTKKWEESFLHTTCAGKCRLTGGGRCRIRVCVPKPYIYTARGRKRG